MSHAHHNRVLSQPSQARQQAPIGHAYAVLQPGKSPQISAVSVQLLNVIGHRPPPALTGAPTRTRWFVCVDDDPASHDKDRACHARCLTRTGEILP
jgi:hypothetical protein